MGTKILIRFDDICPTMDWTQWQRAMDVLEPAGARPLLGVIPECRDPELQLESAREDFWDYVAGLQKLGFTIAMHGCHHVYDSDMHGIVNLTPRSEFAGHSYKIQYEKIKKGKEVLSQHGINTDVFFAPAHSYDEFTLMALADNGFRYISDGKSARPFLRQGIVCIPCRSSGCPEIGKDGYYTAVFHAHEWTKPEKAAGFQKLVRLCREHREELCSFEDFAAWPRGGQQTQLLSEKAYMLYDCRIRPTLSGLKHRIMR